ncbi:unnamed protein product [Cylindrotheca closterium]|uniref:Uncharacterized protein n=1 Tax=Cylindrotheca closterium TaxID=2856 RepID=A0AAD2FNL5_9STRA|nr:unnamed protein product [Cylindrotheca closterium]
MDAHGILEARGARVAESSVIPLDGMLDILLRFGLRQLGKLSVLSLSISDRLEIKNKRSTLDVVSMRGAYSW